MPHSSILGPKWQSYWASRGRNGHDNDLTPKVDVAIKIYECADVDERAGRFHCIFVVLMVS